MVNVQLDNDEGIESNEPFIYTNEIRVENNLLKLLSDMNVPNYAFKQIMKWAKDAHHTGYNFDATSTSYKSQIKKMEGYSPLKNIRPHVKQVDLMNDLENPSDTTSFNVVCFNFASMLSSILHDKDINKMDNLCQVCVTKWLAR